MNRATVDILEREAPLASLTRTSRADRRNLAHTLMGTAVPGSVQPSMASAEPKLAEIIAAVVLCGEIGTVAAAVNGDFVKAHESLGKNRTR